MVGLFLKNTTLCGKILHYVVKHSVLWYNITFLWYDITFCSTFVVYLWYICDIFVIFFAMGELDCKLRETDTFTCLSKISKCFFVK